MYRCGGNAARCETERPLGCFREPRKYLHGAMLAPARVIWHGNPIESVFATVRHRTVRTKGALSQKTARLMVFKLVIAASKTWRRLKGENQLPRVVEGVKFADGVAITATSTKDAA